MLVCYDLLGLTSERVPRFVKRYDNFYERGVAAIARFRSEVQTGAFPSAEHSFGPIPERATPPQPNGLAAASERSDSEPVRG